MSTVACPLGASLKKTTVQLVSNPSYGTTTDSSMSEISGVGVSRQTVNGQTVVWVVSDKGGKSKAQVTAYGVKTRDRLARMDFSASLKAGGEIDYEGLAVGPCSGAAGAPTCVYVGEIGNNSAREAAGQSGRAVSNIYRIVEPTLPTTIDVKSPVMLSVTADVISLDSPAHPDDRAGAQQRAMLHGQLGLERPARGDCVRAHLARVIRDPRGLQPERVQDHAPHHRGGRGRRRSRGGYRDLGRQRGPRRQHRSSCCRRRLPSPGPRAAPQARAS